MNAENEIEELKHRIETLEQLVRSILSKVTEVRIECSVPRIVYERKYEYIKVSEDELYGRIIRLALEVFSTSGGAPATWRRSF
jgi:phosphopantetheine adenylyltransferase